MSNDKHTRLVQALRTAAESGAQDVEENLFLVEIVTSATRDTLPEYDLTQVYEALVDSQASSLLDPLNLLPLLIPFDHPATPKMLQLISREASPKETVIAVQEALERLRDPACTHPSLGLMRLLEVCENALSRFKLRRKGPVDTLRPIIENLSAAIEGVAPSSSSDTGKTLISLVSRLINAVIPWLSQNSGTDVSELKAGTDLLTGLLYSTLSACSSHIGATLAQRRFETLYPAFTLQPGPPSSKSERGMEVAREAVGTSRLLGVSFEHLTKSPIDAGQLILLAHSYPTLWNERSANLNTLLPAIISSIRQNHATDESLALLLTLISSSKETLAEDVVNDLAALLTSLASTHPDPQTRLLTFRILAMVLARSPPPVHLAHLSSLLTDCPFPQMRVAAVGLAKEAFLNEIDSSPSPSSSSGGGGGKTTFASPTLIRAIGPAIFRPDPPDLFANISMTSSDALKRFVESSEPVRLTECLAFYYVLLKRDSRNSTGIRDKDVIKSVENSLLSPLRKALATWVGDTFPGANSRGLMPLVSLKISMERIDEAVLSLRTH